MSVARRTGRVLLVRPASPNERFGLGPFFRVEPLGLEYVAAALEARGHVVEIHDFRLSHRLPQLLGRFAPDVVGIASLHTLDTNAALEVARAVKRHDPRIFTLVGGHAAAVYPPPLLDSAVDAVGFEDGEVTVPALVDAVLGGGPRDEISGFWLRARAVTARDAFADACPRDFVRSPSSHERPSLDLVPLPARHLLRADHRHYRCVHKTPLYAIETARGCPYRCAFCSVWRHVDRSYRLRDIDAVCTDFARAGGNVFVVDDLFFHPRQRSFELARQLRRRRVKKDWLLVQARLDTVARSPELLEAWRPVANHFDIFFGFEAPTNEQLDALAKDADLAATEEGVRIARHYGYGVTGNFVIDPDWAEQQFEQLWDFVDRLELRRTGYTVLTPLPGTPLFDRFEGRVVERDWSKYDMHHLLYEPRLGRERFFELFVESWKRNVLSSKYSARNWWRWAKGLTVPQALALFKVLVRTQRMLDVRAYLDETFPLQLPAMLEETMAPGGAVTEP